MYVGNSIVQNRENNLKGEKVRITWGKCPPLTRKIVKNWNSCQYYQASQGRIPDIVVKGVVQKHSRSQYKQGGNHRISPDLVRTWRIRFTTAEHENCAAGNHIEKPFGEDRQRE